MNKELEQKLIDIAREECFVDDEDTYKYVDGYVADNVDEAFAMGEDQGRILLAREILLSMGVDWT